MIPAGVRIFVCTEPVDMRLGFDRLAQTARDIVGLGADQWCVSMPFRAFSAPTTSTSTGYARRTDVIATTAQLASTRVG
jgi:hypothetical protein